MQSFHPDQQSDFVELLHLTAMPAGADPLVACGVADNVSDGWRTIMPHIEQRPEAKVLVTGREPPGSIGLCAAGFAVALGAGDVVYADHDPGRLAIAGRLGATPHRLRREGGLDGLADDFDITVDSAWEPSLLTELLGKTGRAGVRTSVAGPLYMRRDVTVPAFQMYRRSITDRASSMASIYRRGDPASVHKVADDAKVTMKGGRCGAAHRAPPTAPDPALWPAADFATLVTTFEAHGFRAPCAWYLNDEANIAYMRTAPDGGRVAQPVLFVNGDWDQMNTIRGNHLGEPMREACADLTVASLEGAHWLPLDRKAELTRAIHGWLRAKGL